MMPGLPFVKKETWENRNFYPQVVSAGIPEENCRIPVSAICHSLVDVPIWTSQCYVFIIYYHSVICQYNNTFIINFYKRGNWIRISRQWQSNVVALILPL